VFQLGVYGNRHFGEGFEKVFQTMGFYFDASDCIGRVQDGNRQRLLLGAL
jgi:hypothetical protein